MKIERFFSREGQSPYQTVEYETRRSVLKNPDGSVLSQIENIEVPQQFSQVAADILAQKYFRRAGVPDIDPETGHQRRDANGRPITRGERSIKEVVHRLAGCWRHWGETHGYFDSAQDAQIFYDELVCLLLEQRAAPNSPQWFNTGLAWAYGITGVPQGHWRVNPATGELERSKDAYTHPQPHACQPWRALVSTPDGPIPIGQIVEELLLGLEVFDKDGITRVVAVRENGLKPVLRVVLKNGKRVEATADHLVLAQLDPEGPREWVEVGDLRPGMRLLQRVDASIRAEALAGGGGFWDRDFAEESPKYRSPMILRVETLGEEPVFDIQTESGNYLSNSIVVHNCFIQSIKDDLVNEGGIMDLWTREARVFKYGSGTGTNFSSIRGEGEPLSGGGRSSGLMSFLKIGDRAAGAIKSGGTTRRAAKMVVLNMDHPDIVQFINWKSKEEKKAKALIAAGYDSDFDGDAYHTISGQNSNNSVRAPQEFLEAVERGDKWRTTRRVDGKVAGEYDARDLWNQVCQAAWECADPGVQYDTTINDWHTCPADGRINASNPCSEFVFLDDTACNLASLNLLKFYNSETREFDVAGFEHACRLWAIVLEISVLMAQFPSEEIARKSYDFRTLGLGYANLGALLMTAGIPYDSDEGRAWAGAITALMTGVAYRTSAEMAAALGPFAGWERNRDHMLRVMRNHRRAAHNAPKEDYEGLSVAPLGIDPDLAPPRLLEAARRAWDEALELGEKHGYRNAQATVIAPTGTIGLAMDCVAGDTRVITELGEYSIAELCDFAATSGVQVLKVLTMDPESGEASWEALNLAWIKPAKRELVEIETEDGRVLRCTPDHRVLTTRGFKAAGDLTPQDEIVDAESALALASDNKTRAADTHLT